MSLNPLPSQESAPLAYIFCLTGQECSLTCWAEMRENTAPSTKLVRMTEDQVFFVKEANKTWTLQISFTSLAFLAMPWLVIIPVALYPKKVDCGCKMHKCYTFSPLPLEILLNTKVKYYESGITNILSLREDENKFPLISFTFYFCYIFYAS